MLLLMAGMAFGAAGTMETKPRSADLAWLGGAWASVDVGVETEETWLAPKGGVMLGMNRTTKNAANAGFEFMRLEDRPGGVVFLAQPSGKPPTEFPLKELKGKRAVFENPAHDFPQRVIYRMDHRGRMVGRIEGQLGGAERALEWVFERVKP